MPWDSSDAYRHTKKATSPVKKKVWSKVANRELSSGASEGSAIRQANAVVSRIKKRRVVVRRGRSG
jgi:hypothetical protein